MYYQIETRNGSFESKEGQSLNEAALAIAKFLAEEGRIAPNVTAVYKWDKGDYEELAQSACGYVEAKIEDYLEDEVTDLAEQKAYNNELKSGYKIGGTL